MYSINDNIDGCAATIYYVPNSVNIENINGNITRISGNWYVHWAMDE